MSKSETSQLLTLLTHTRFITTSGVSQIICELVFRATRCHLPSQFAEPFQLLLVEDVSLYAPSVQPMNIWKTGRGGSYQD